MGLQSKIYTHRFLARIIIEAKTPIAIGSGQKNALTDEMIALDANKLPYIPGTSIAGVIRSMLDPARNDDEIEYLFGSSNKHLGSEIIFSEGKILDSLGNVIDGLVTSEKISSDTLLRHYQKILPVRQHVCINEKGVAKNTAKYDQQVVFAGSRFCFEIEIVSNGQNLNMFSDIINNIQLQSFRLGGSTHKGLGKIEVVSVQTAILDLSKEEDLQIYLTKSSCLSNHWEGWSKHKQESINDDCWEDFSLDLVARDVIQFGSGCWDLHGIASTSPVKESIIIWKDGKGEMIHNMILIPASSIKGALRHRVAYRYNKLNNLTIYGDQGTPYDADHCPAVIELFGGADPITPGHIEIDDIFMNVDDGTDSTYMTHVKIDRFTGGSINQALFTESVDNIKNRLFRLSIRVEKKSLTDANRKALEAALNDLKSGLLPLGGGTNRGHGFFLEKK